MNIYKKRSFKGFFYGLLFSLLFLPFLQTTVHAQEVSLGVYPPLIQLQEEPNNLVEYELVIKNISQEPVDVSILLQPFEPSDSNDGSITFPTQIGTYNKEYETIFKNTVFFTNSQPISDLSLAPNQENNITVSTQLPENIGPGDYYFSVIFISKPINSQNTSTSAGISTNVLLTVGAKSEATGELVEFSTNTFFEKGPVPFTVTVKNTSENVITPTGEILITNMFGQKVGKITLLPMNILANSNRSFSDTSQLPKDMNDKTILSLKPQAIWNESFLLGVYNATVTIHLSEEGPIFSKTISFYAFPAQFIVGFIIALIIVLLIRSRLKKHM